MSKTFTVSEISKLIKDSLEKNPLLNSVLIKGEISNLTNHTSGHIYFTLKDADSIIKVVFFKYSNKGLRFKLEEGLSVIVLGSVKTYEKQSSYQIIINDIFLEGVGALQLKIEQLKKKLFIEGIFSPERKIPLPHMPLKIGIVTSPTGAAFRDILKVALRRFPNIDILLAPAKVQGDDAPAAIAHAINILNDPKWNIDVIIAGRGGGSFEDLMAFNEEIVVRAFAESIVPIISAVGHQIDHPLSDDAADVYVPTPSAAAELAIPEISLIENFLKDNLYIIRKTTEKILEENKYRVSVIKSGRIFQNPKDTILMKNSQNLDDLISRLIILLKDRVIEKKHLLTEISDINLLMKNIYKTCVMRYKNSVQSLEQLSPLKVITRGYSIVYDKNDSIVKTVDKLSINENITVTLSDGNIKCIVNDIIKKGE